MTHQLEQLVQNGVARQQQQQATEEILHDTLAGLEALKYVVTVARVCSRVLVMLQYGGRGDGRGSFAPGAICPTPILQQQGDSLLAFLSTNKTLQVMFKVHAIEHINVGEIDVWANVIPT